MYWKNLPKVKTADGRFFNQVLTVIDRASKQFILIPCADTCTAHDVAEMFLHEVVRHCGLRQRRKIHQRILEDAV